MNRVKKLLTSFIIFAGVLGVASALGFNDGILTNPFEARAVEQSTTITVNSSVTNSSGFTATTYVHPDNSEFVLNFDHVKAGGGVGTIKGGSYVRRTEATKDIKSIKVDFSSTNGNELKIQTWYASNDVYKFTDNLKDNEAYTGFRGNYFCLIAGDKADVRIESIEVVFGCTTLAARPNTSTDTIYNHYGKWSPNKYSELKGVYTWDDKTNDISWFVVEMDLLNNATWDTTNYFPTLSANNYIKEDNGKRFAVKEVRLLTEGRFELFVSMFDTERYGPENLVPGNGDFYCHLNYGGYWYDGTTKGDLKPPSINGNTVLSQDGNKKTHASGSCSAGKWTVFSAWGMANITLEWN